MDSRRRVVARDALADALSLVARRDFSRALLQQRLLRKGHSPEDAAAACERCAGYGYIDDRRFGLARSAGLVQRRASSRRELVQDLQRQLLAPKMAESVVDQALRDAGGEEAVLQRALQRWCSRHGKPDSLSQAKRCFDHLIRRGFPKVTVRRALSDWLDALVSQEQQ